MKHKITPFFYFTISLLLCTFSCDERTNIQPLTESWEKAIPHQEIPEGLSSMSAKQCGICHQEHYKEWRMSTHSHAWTDLQFQAELKKPTSPFMCINCHIPLQNQQEYIVDGLIDGDIYKPSRRKNPHFDKDLQQEGITCASCHVRNNTIIGTIGSDKAPHKTIKDVKFLSETLCISCHNATAVITPSLACSFETGDEWKAGPYYGKQNCIQCHMDTIERPLVHGFENRKSHYHYFAGSGIPKFDTVETMIKNGLAFYPKEMEQAYSILEEIDYSFKVKNEFAGHRVPTGNPERFFLITMTIKNTTDSILHSKTDRIGEHWQWHPTAKKLSDNNLLPNESRTFYLQYTPTTKEDIQLDVKVSKHRMDPKTAEYNKLGSEYPLFITIYDTTYQIKIRE